MQCFYIIYKLTFPNGKIYIGQTGDFNRRMNDYKNLNNSIGRFVKNAIIKYGWENVKKEILFTTSQEFVDELETKMIAEYKSADRKFGYNILKEAKTMRGFRHSEETKEKISKIHKGKQVSDETKKKQKEANLNKKRTDEQKEKYSKAKKGKNHPMFGKHIPEKTKQLMRKAKLGKNNSMFGIKRPDIIKRNIELLSILNKKPVNAYIKKTDEFVGTFESVKQAGIKLNLFAQCICAVLKNRQKSAGGYYFRYKESK